MTGSIPAAFKAAALKAYMINHHLVATRWGGRRQRYAQNNGTALRVHDPVTFKKVEFGSDLQLEAWHLHRFDPTVKAIVVGHFHLKDSTFSEAQLRSIQLDVAFHDGQRLLEHICTEEWAGRAAQLKRIAKALGAQCRVRTRADIRASLTRVNCLRRLRQAMVMHPAAGSSTEILQAICFGAGIDRARLLAELPQFSTEFVDAGIGYFLRKGEVELDLKGGRYGNESTVTRV